MTYRKFLGKYDVLELSSYKKIIAEDKHFIVLKIWERSKQEEKSIYRIFQKYYNYMIKDYIVRSDNIPLTNSNNHFIDAKTLNPIKIKMLFWLFYDEKRYLNGTHSKSLVIFTGRIVDKERYTEIARPIEIAKTTKKIRKELLKHKI